MFSTVSHWLLMSCFCFSQPSPRLHYRRGLSGIRLTLRRLCQLRCLRLPLRVCKDLHEDYVFRWYSCCCKCLYKFICELVLGSELQDCQSHEWCYVALFTFHNDFLYFPFAVSFSVCQHVCWFLQQMGYYNLQTSLSMILLAMSMVMAGTGNLKVLQLCRFFHKRTGGEMNYGFHMAHHMALGLLFLGGGRWDSKNTHIPWHLY